MNTTEIKIDLFKRLDALSSKDLKETYGLVLNYINSRVDTKAWNELTKEQQDALKVGIEQLDNGEGRTGSEVLADFRKRFL